MSPSASPTLEETENLQRRLFAWALLCGILLCGALAGPFYAGLIYSSDDLWAFHIPLRFQYAQSLAAGERFDWSPHLFCGFYLTGEGQLGTYHPLHLLLYRFFEFRAALDLELLVSYPLLLAGTGLLLARHVRDRAAACYGGLTFAFCGFNLLHFVHPNAVAIVAHIPWLLWLMEVRLESRNRWTRASAEAGIALLTASQLLLGYPQYVWFSLLLEAAWLTYLWRARQLCWPAGLRLATAKGLGLLAGGVQLLPTLDALASSQRQAVDAAFVQSGSLHPLNFLQLLGPYLFSTRVAGQNTHELGLYAGAVPLMLIAWLLTQRRQWGGLRPWIWFSLAIFGLALLLAMGSHGGLYTLQTWLPLVGKFRMPARYIVLVHWAVAMLAATAFALLVRQVGDKKQSDWSELGPLWRLSAASALLALLGPWLWPEHVASPRLVWTGPALLALAAGAVTLAARQMRLGFVGLIVLTAIDLGAYGMSYGVYPNAVDLDDFLAAGPQWPGVGSGQQAAGRVAVQLPAADESMRAGNHLIVRGWRQVDGYAGLEPSRQLDYRQLAALRVAGVAWVLRSESTEAVPGLIEHDATWFEVPEPLARVRLVGQAVASTDEARDLNRINLETQALVEVAPPTLDLTAKGSAALAVDRPGELVIDVETSGRQLLCVAESFHRGWQATINGLPAAVYRVNGDFLGCVVEPGRHRVVWEFRPHSLALGKQASLTGLGLIAFWFLIRLVWPRLGDPRRQRVVS